MKNIGRILSLLALAALMPLLSFADDSRATAPVGSDLPPEAKLEVKRLNEHVFETGTIQAGPDAALIGAVETPLDDSDRWWFTVILPPADANPEVKAATSLLIKHINERKFEQWVMPGDPKSWALFQSKQVDSQIQQDWLKSPRKYCDRFGYPGVLIQPPKNQEFGPNRQVVAMLAGYTGNHDEWNTIISDRVKAYTFRLDGAVRESGGHEQYARESSGRPRDPQQDKKPVPFDPPKPPVFPPDDAIEHLLPEKKPKFYTYTQVRQLAPEAPTKWVRELVKAGVTTDDEVSEAYDEWKDEQKEAKLAREKVEKEKHVAPPAQPPLPTASTPLAPPLPLATYPPLVVTQEPSETEVDQTPANFPNQADGTANYQTDNPPSSEHAETETPHVTTENPITISLTLVAIVVGLCILWKSRNKTESPTGSQRFQMGANVPRSTRNESNTNATSSPSNATVASSTRNTQSHPGPLPGSLGVYSEDQAGP